MLNMVSSCYSSPKRSCSAFLITFLISCVCNLIHRKKFFGILEGLLSRLNKEVNFEREETRARCQLRYWVNIEWILCRSHSANVVGIERLCSICLWITDSHMFDVPFWINLKTSNLIINAVSVVFVQLFATLEPFLFIVDSPRVHPW